MTSREVKFEQSLGIETHGRVVIPFASHSLTQTPQAALRWTKRRDVQRCARLAARLVRMTPAEVVQRIRLAVRKRYPGLLAKQKANARRVDRCAAEFLEDLGSGLIPRLSERFDSRFFFGPSQSLSIAITLKQQFPDVAQRIVEAAKIIVDGNAIVLGQLVRLSPGEIDWQADPRSHRRMWTDGELDEAMAISAVGADVKYVWEVNRHQFLVVLGRAFSVTGEHQYLRLAVALIEDWISHNPVGRGVNWCSHLEIAMRAISWLWVMPHLLSWPQLDEDFLRRWLASIAEHHRYLSRNLSVFTDPTNHLIGEATALWMLSVCFPELSDSEAQAQLALRILEKEIERQVTSDGVNKEQATSYHRFVLDFYLQVLILSQRLGNPLAPVVAQRVEAMLEFVAALVGEHADAPMVGDSDDARGFPTSEPSGWDFRDCLATGAALFDRPEWMYSAGGVREETLWLIGNDVALKYANLPAFPPVPCSRIFALGGYCFFNAASRHGQNELIFDVGPLGLWPNAAHGHADALSVLVRINGRILLADPGTGTYFEDLRVRNSFRQTSAHNTLTIDNLDQADIHDTFKWVNPMRVRLIESYVGTEFDYAFGQHDGYRRLRNGITHSRAVLFVKPGTWIIIDQASGEGKHLFTRHFNFHPAVELSDQGPCNVIAVDKESRAVLRISSPVGPEATASRHQFDYDGGWSDRYGQWQKAPRLKIVTQGEAPLTFFTVISAGVGLGAPDLASESSTYDSATLANGQAVYCHGQITDVCADVEEVLLVNPQRLDLTLPGKLRTNSRVLFIRQLADGTIDRALMVGEHSFLEAPDFRLQSRHEKFASFCANRSIQSGRF